MQTYDISVPVASQTGKRSRGLSGWLVDRGHDAMRWPNNLARDFSCRRSRLALTLSVGALLSRDLLTGRFEARAAIDAQQSRMRGPDTSAKLSRAVQGHLLTPGSRRVTIAAWVLVLGTRLFDLAGGPEVTEFLLRGVTHSTSLTEQEQAAAARILGHTALRWPEVRVAEGGVLDYVFRRNGNRAFTTWHTINLPAAGAHVRQQVSILIHELVHVYQYERTGSSYILQALAAQHSRQGYDYGKARGLELDRAAGKRYVDYNREQQAQIVQDYYTLLHNQGRGANEEEARQWALGCYAPYLAEMCAGKI